MGTSDVGEKTPEGEVNTGDEKVVAAGKADVVNAVAGSIQQNVYVENLTAQQPEEESVCDDSEIREARTFSKREILEKIVAFAVANKLELKGAKVSRIVTNKEGVIILLIAVFPNDDGSYQRINFTIKGVHGSDFSTTTGLDRTFWDKNDMPEGGDVVVEYLEGEWVNINYVP